MAQEDAFEVTQIATDISAGRDEGCYVATISIDTNAEAPPLLYATAETAPASDRDYFLLDLDQYFSFRSGPGILPTWVKQPTRPHFSFDAFLAVAKVD